MKGKSVCKVSLQQHLGLQEKASIVLVVCIFSDISDIELENLKMFIWMASRRGVQFVFMGSGQTPGLNTALEYFEEELKFKAMRYGAMPILLDFTDSKFGHFVDRDLEGTEFSHYIKDTFFNMPLNQAIDELKNNP